MIVIMWPWVFGCSNDDNPFPSGSYLYRGFDNEQQEVTSGEITFVVDGSLISGKKNITGESLESGESSVEGWVDEDETIHIRLTFNKGPNILIIGHYEDGWLNGRRFMELMSGLQVVGTFKAKKIDNTNVYRQIAWDYIDGEHNETIMGNMDDGIVQSDHYGDALTVSVTWHTTQDALVGPITIHIDPYSMEVVGINPRL